MLALVCHSSHPHVFNILGKWSEMMFSYHTNQTLALTYKDYMNGKWKNDNLSEVDLYDTVSPKIFNLVKKVLIRNLTSPFSDAYEEITYDIHKNTNYEAIGIEFTRKDYYVTLKTYCLTLKYSDFWLRQKLVIPKLLGLSFSQTELSQSQ